MLECGEGFCAGRLGIRIGLWSGGCVVGIVLIAICIVGLLWSLECCYLLLLWMINILLELHLICYR